MKEINLKVEGMMCTGCENRIQNAVKNMNGIKSVKADHTTGIVKIEAECFPAAEAATKISIAERLAVYPNHFWVQLDGDRMIGFVNGMVTDDPDLRDEMYEDASLHNENGA